MNREFRSYNNDSHHSCFRFHIFLLRKKHLTPNCYNINKNLLITCYSSIHHWSSFLIFHEKIHENLAKLIFCLQSTEHTILFYNLILKEMHQKMQIEKDILSAFWIIFWELKTIPNITKIKKQLSNHLCLKM